MNLRLAAFISFFTPVTFLSAQAVSFLPPVTTAISEYSGLCTICIVSADFNGDGKTDVGYLGTQDTLSDFVSVATGNGDGTFRPGPSYPFTISGGKANIFTADFNRDGRQDLLVSADSTLLYPGNGDGTFQSPVSIAGCPHGQPAPVPVSAVADFNGDKNPDLVCGTNILLGNGDGTFHAGVTVDSGASSAVVLVADFNHDGVADLVIQKLSGRLLIALGHGDGAFDNDIPYPIDDALYGTVAADFNGDGKIDLVSYSSTEGLLVFTPGNGDGTFGAAVHTANSGIFEASAVADFNSDGKPDLLTTAGAVLAGKGDGTFLSPVFFGSYGLPTLGDFNGDGLPDLAEVAPNPPPSYLSALLNDGSGDGLLTPGVSSATMSWVLGPNSVVSAFGNNLASTTATASSYPMQTTLGGIRVHVGLPPNDTLAPLLYVSPSQINYLLPYSGTDFVPISIEHIDSPYVPKGIGIAITPNVVSFYTVGAGIAAGYAVRVGADGTQTPVPVVSCASSPCTAVPIDVSNDAVYLSLFGTGFDIVSGGLNCTTGNREIPVTYAGSRQQIPGLDQVNLMLPRALAGSGAISITCNALGLYNNGFPPLALVPDGPPSNPVAITIQ
ncbi:MAG TPA: FG-GAP-like repeat-containing protein [Bryobacteraceae bacterium]|nr:FG-GAP-like repeat-containing protein [Bryobacteraceae bacterium]